MYKYLLAVKYLMSRPINLIGTVGITVAVWALILVVSIFTGYIGEMRLHIRATAADVSFLFNRCRDSYREVASVLAGTPGVLATAPRLSWYGLVDPQKKPATKPGEIDPLEAAGKPATNFFQLIGIDPEAENRIRDFRSELTEDIDAGLRVRDLERPFLTGAENGGEEWPGIVIGIGRAQSWKLRRGDRLTVTTAKEAPPGSREPILPVTIDCIVTGVFSSRHFEFENSSVFVELGQLRKQLAPPGAPQDAFNEIAITLEDPARGKEVCAEINRRIQQAGFRGEAFTWQQRPRFTRFLDNVENQRGLMSIVLFVLMFVSAFLTFATLLMMVSEKTRDIGVLASLGATRSGTLMVFVLCGLVISFVGAVIGTVTAWVSCVFLNDINDWITGTFDVVLFPKDIYGLKEVPYELDPVWIATVCLIAIGTSLLFSLVPAFLAARLDPVQALRRE